VASGTGECVILWGPATDVALTTTLTGSFSPAGNVTLSALVESPTGERGFDVVDLAGKVDVGLHQVELREYTIYNPDGLDPMDAALGVTLN
jgi:hypothetical protein